MKRLVAAALLCLASLFAPAARAEEAPRAPLALDEVRRAAAARHPAILAALRDREAAGGEALAADGGFDPSWRSTAAASPLGGYRTWRVETAVEQPTPLWGASVFAGYRASSALSTFPVYDGKYATNAYGEVRAGLRVPVLRDGPIDRRRANVRSKDLGQTIADLSVEQQRIEIDRIASQRYWDWAAAGLRLSIAQGWLTLAAARDADFASRAEAGDIAAIDRTENRRTILQRQALLLAAERALAEAANELSLYLRDPSGAPVVPGVDRLPAALPDPSPVARSPQADTREALARRPDLPRIEAQREQARVEEAWARNQRLPALDVVIAGSKDFGPGDPKLDKPAVEVAVVLDVPLLGRVANGRAQAARAAAAKLDEQARLTRDRIAADVRNASVAVETAAARAKTAAEELSIARALAEAEMDRFRAGATTLLIVNLREQAAAEAALRHVDALADYHKALAAQRAALGRRAEP